MSMALIIGLIICGIIIYKFYKEINVIKNKMSELSEKPFRESEEDITNLKKSIDKLINLVSSIDEKITRFLETKEIKEEIKPEITPEEKPKEIVLKEIVEREEIKPEEEIKLEEVEVEKVTPKGVPLYKLIEPEKPKEKEVEEVIPPSLPSVPSVPPTLPPEPPRKFYEAEIGLRWFSRIGIIFLVVGIAFFIKYAIDVWLGPIGRLALGIIIGLILLGLGEYFDRKEKYIGYARGLTGGAFAILYFTVYASYHFYKSETGIPLSVNIILLSAIVFFGLTFAIKYDSILIASEAFLLGYFTSYLTGAYTIYTLIYSTLLALALLYLVYKKGWLIIGVGGLSATYILHINWLRQNQWEYHTNLVFLLIYFFMFAFLSLILKGRLKLPDVSNVSQERKYLIYAIFAVSIFIPLFLINLINIYAVYYLILAYALVRITLKYKLEYLGAAGVAVNYYIFYAWWQQNKYLLYWPSIYLITYFILFSIYSILYGLRNKKATENIIIVLLNTFCFFGFSFYKIKMDYEIYAGLFTILMSAICLILSYISSFKKIAHLFITYLVLGIVFITLTIPIQLGKEWTHISWAVESLILLYLSIRFKNLPLRILSQAVGVVAVISALYYVYYADVIGTQVIITYIVSVVSFYLSAILYHQEAIETKDEKDTILSDISLYVATFLLSLLLFLKFKGASLSIAFAGEGLLLAFASFIWKRQSLRICSQIIAIPTIVYTLLSYRHPYFFSYLTFDKLWYLAYIINIITFYITAYLYQKSKAFLSQYEEKFYIIYSSIATFLTTFFLALYFKGAWISIAWGIQAVVILCAGFYLKNKYVRFVGIGIFVLTILKTIVIDISKLEMIYRVVSLIGLGVILLVASYIYYRYREQIEELFEEKK